MGSDKLKTIVVADISKGHLVMDLSKIRKVQVLWSLFVIKLNYFSCWQALVFLRLLLEDLTPNLLLQRLVGRDCCKVALHKTESDLSDDGFFLPHGRF